MAEQAPATPSPAPTPGKPLTTQPVPAPSSTEAGPGVYIGAGIAALLVALFLFALARQRARRRKEMEEPTARKQLEAKERIEAPPLAPPEEKPAPRRERPVEKPVEKTQAELEAEQAAKAAEEARLAAKRLAEEAREHKEKLAEAEAAKVSAAKAREEAEAAQKKAEEEEQRRRAEEEERKKEEYRQRKAREAEEKERRRLEAEEAKRREEEEARLKAEQEEAERRRLEEEEKKKIAAQAGRTLAEGLSKTRGGFMAGLNNLLGRNRAVDESVLGELEEVLFSADIGVKTATELLDFARQKVRAKDLADAEKLKDAMRGEVQRLVNLDGKRDWSAHKPYVLMVVGVNGSGKTTTIGKLAAQLTSQGKKVLLAAGDTFRAAATEQLEVWGQRANAPVVKGKEGSDPGAVIFDAIKRGRDEGYDMVICDTAGRLHTKAPLMEELKRVKRVMEKALPGSPHETLIVLDATIGQNAVAQAREFHGAVGVDGIVLTKLDGTAKGGVVIGICGELKLPVRYVGIGEAVGDLKGFSPQEFVEALFA